MLSSGLAAAGAPAAEAPAGTADPDGVAYFEQRVRPLLTSNCLKCHGGEAKIKGGLRLTSRESLLKGGDTGTAAVPGAPDKSLLIEAIHYGGELKMPPDQKLSAEQVATLTEWVKRGLPWTPDLDLTPAGVAVDAPAHAGPPKPEDARGFWSFQPVRRPDVPAANRLDWVRNPVDAFVLAKLEANGLSPAPPADPVALLRRAYYDLTGLPPTPQEVNDFLADAAPDAYERVIDRLLASPHYGEKWGRHWLDLVRYAETNSYERDNPKPNVWRYRDYVIRSFNQDKPYDRFLKEQLAGDELPDPGSNPDAVVATGFYRLGVWDDEPADRMQARYESFDDIVATVGQSFLGLTFDCARCHDHKIDPIPQADYYRLLAFVHNVNDYHNGGPTDERPLSTPPADAEAYEQQVRERARRIGEARAAIDEVRQIFRQLLQGEAGRGDVPEADVPRLLDSDGARVLGTERFAAYRKLTRELESLRSSGNGADKALCVTEAGPTAPETFVWIRGNAGAQGEKVEPGFPQVLGGSGPAAVPPPPPGAKSSGRRTVLADWIASKDNPLTARVMVNRIWQYHFGRGLVRTPNDFGLQGERPTHPELLDWLAAEFVERGWSMKAMHRLLMTANTYRMSSGPDPKALAADPRNDLLWRFDLRRLTAEEIRDSVLAVNGTLNLKAGGPSVYPPIPPEVMQTQSKPGEGWHTSPPEEAARRSVYVHVKRSLRVPLLESFDAAETDKSCPVRFVTTLPTQALGMLNSAFLNEEAEKFARRLRQETGDDVRKQVALGLKLVTCREPSEKDVLRGVELIESLVKKDGANPDVALRYFCLVALNLNEFVYLD